MVNYTQYIQKQCINCHHFSLIENEKSMGICRLNPPKLTAADLECLNIGSGFPTVLANQWCGKWDWYHDSEFDVGCYAIVNANCFDVVTRSRILKNESQLVQILGCPKAGFYEIVTTNQFRDNISPTGEKEWTGVRLGNDKINQRMVVEGQRLTRIRLRFKPGDYVRLAVDELSDYPGESHIPKTGDIVEIVEIREPDSYKARFGAKESGKLINTGSVLDANLDPKPE